MPDRRSFFERMRYDHGRRELVEDRPLRERFPEYLRSLAKIAAITGGIGVVFGLLIAGGVVSGIGYGWALSGAFMLLEAGIRGGGYNDLSIGAYESMVGRAGFDPMEVQERKREAMVRMRRGLRPPPNPEAFWEMVGGFVLLVAGIPLTA